MQEGRDEGQFLTDPVWPGLFYKHLRHWLIKSSFSSQSSKHHNFQTVRASDLKFWHNVHHPLCVICRVSRVTKKQKQKNCDKVVELVGGGSVINGAYPV